jgi:hypothetical protein
MGLPSSLSFSPSENLLPPSAEIKLHYHVLIRDNCAKHDSTFYPKLSGIRELLAERSWDWK